MQDDATEFVISERDFQLKRMEETRTAIHEARTSGNWDRVPADVYRKLLDKIDITTLPTVHGRKISDTLGMITAEGLYLVTIPDLSVDFPQMDDAEQQLQAAGGKTLEKLRVQALKAGADAVVDVKTSHNLIGLDGDRHRFLIACSGTAVKLD